MEGAALELYFLNDVCSALTQCMVHSAQYPRRCGDLTHEYGFKEGGDGGYLQALE